MRTQMIQRGWSAMLLLALALLAPMMASAHCDTLDGPVVTDARIALEKGDVTPVLKWVREADAKEVTAAFTRTLAVRKLGPEAKTLADQYFFETLVRIHRAGEGEPYTGLKPAGTVEPVIAMTDAAVASGKNDALAAAISKHLAEGINAHFARVVETRKHANDSVAAGRAYVAAYVTFLHYVEGIHAAVANAAHHGAEAAHETPPDDAHTAAH